MLGAFRTIKASGAEAREGQRIHAAARQAWQALAGNIGGLSIQSAFLVVLASAPLAAGQENPPLTLGGYSE